MPVSSRSIIRHIEAMPASFTTADLLNALFHSTQPKKKSRGKKKQINLTAREHSLIETALHVLTNAGFIAKLKNTYRKIHSFTIEGAIVIGRDKSCSIEIFSGADLMISPKHAMQAQYNDFVTARIVSVKSGMLWGEVVSISKRHRELYTAYVKEKTPVCVVCGVMDLPGGVEFAAPRHAGEPQTGSFAVIRPLSGHISSFAKCEIISTYQRLDESFDFERISLKHSLPRPYSKNFEKLAEWDKVLENEQSDRKDYSKGIIITIDPQDAKDHDDAVTVVRKGDFFRLFVHIADVSAYIPVNCELDLLAQSRATSVYLGNRVIPMLPARLSNDLCSLREGVKRLSMSVEMLIDQAGNILEHSFHRGIITVTHRLTYAMASEILETNRDDDLSNMLNDMHSLAKILYEKRVSDGSLDLNLREEKLKFDGDKVSAILFAERQISNRIIEEFMLIANTVVSRQIKISKIPCVYRVHETMSDDAYLSLKIFLKSIGINLRHSGSRSQNLQDVILKVTGKEYENIVNMALLRSFMQAYYCVEPLGHFGLGFGDYTHFTSPIRRYPDLVVHRCLKALISGTPPPYSEGALIPIAEKCSETERIAQRAERDFVKIKICRLMADRIGEVFDAMVSGVSKYGFYVTLIEAPVEGMVTLRSLTDDFYLVMEDDYTVIGKRCGKRFRLGDRIKVRLIKVEFERMIMDFTTV
jgi:ribonuclease R